MTLSIASGPLSWLLVFSVCILSVSVSWVVFRSNRFHSAKNTPVAQWWYFQSHCFFFLSPSIFLSSSMLFPELFRAMSLAGLLLSQHQGLSLSRLPHNQPQCPCGWTVFLMYLFNLSCFIKNVHYHPSLSYHRSAPLVVKFPSLICQRLKPQDETGGLLWLPEAFPEFGAMHGALDTQKAANEQVNMW